eukprot:gnl/MRDRNA2_/MRDRNA2_100385_c0_seq1.p1 gnl/MRDRNA2_/MRDRNA2_100385_c0~~gnl/MRDRNA2_/MRDRNA2_100385_c0_seq1.p1  ORF type:complete len:1314 (-),score=182.02 gnl/MRDRNA2_/MRDRNA2_100385_c0_seq1:135-3677(-)
MDPPRNPQYNLTTNKLVCKVGDSVWVDGPSCEGSKPDIYYLNPTALPEGLFFDQRTGALYGIVSDKWKDTQYTVTAENPWGTAETSISIYVPLPEAPTALAYNAPSRHGLWNHAVFTFTCGGVATLGFPTFTGTTPKQFSIEPPDLPYGLKFDETTGQAGGLIPATPEAAIDGSRTYTIRATNRWGSCKCLVEIAVSPQSAPLNLAYNNIPNQLCVGDVVRIRPPNCQGTVPVSYELQPKHLPTGLRFDTLTGEVLGAVRLPLLHTTYQVMAKNVWGSTATNFAIEVPVPDPPSDLGYNTEVRHSMFSDMRYAFSFTVGSAVNTGSAEWNGTRPDRFEIAPSDALPKCLTFDAACGRISGLIPAQPEAAFPLKSFTISAINRWGQCTCVVDLEILPLEPPTDLAYESEYQFRVCKFNVGASVFIPRPECRGTRPEEYSITPTLLPEGLHFNVHTGCVYGIVHGPLERQTYTVKAWNAWGVATTTIQLHVPTPDPPTGLTYNAKQFSPIWRLPCFSFICGQLASTGAPTVSAGSEPTSFVLTPAQLPEGLCFDPTTGEIGGLIPPQSAAMSETYSILASNRWGSCSCEVEIRIQSQREVSAKAIDRRIQADLTAGRLQLGGLRSQLDSMPPSEAIETGRELRNELTRRVSGIEAHLERLEILEQVPLTAHARRWMQRATQLLDKMKSVKEKRTDSIADAVGLVFESHHLLEGLESEKIAPLWESIQAKLDSAPATGSGEAPSGLRRVVQGLEEQRASWHDRFDAQLLDLLPGSRAVIFDELQSVGESLGILVSPPKQRHGPSTQHWRSLLERHWTLHKKVDEQVRRATRRLKAYQQLLQEMPKTAEEMHTFHEQTIGDKVSSIALSLAVAMTAPVPGSMEIWMASSAVILMKTDAASRFLVVEHPPDSSVDDVLSRFGSCPSSQTSKTLDAWHECKVSTKVALVHNATSSTVALMYRQTASKTGKILNAHPMFKIMNKAIGREDPLSAGHAVMIPPSEIAMVHLPDNQEENRELVFRQPNSDQDIGECKLSASSIVSFVSIESGLRVCNQKPGPGEDYAPISSLAIVNESLDVAMIKIANQEAAAGSDPANKAPSSQDQQQLKLEMALQPGAKLYLDVQQPKEDEDDEDDEEDATDNREKDVAPSCYSVEVTRSALGSNNRKSSSACELRGGQVLKIEEGF